MRKLSWIRVALLAILGIGSGSAAHAAALAFEGTIGVAIANLPPINVSGTGVALVTGTGTALDGLSLPAGAFATSVSVPVSDPLAFPLAGVQANPSNGAGSFSGPGLAGQMAILGQATVCLFQACDAAPVANIVVPFTQAGTRGIGLGGGPIVATGLVDVTLQGAPWTLGTVTAASATAAGFAHGPASGGLESAAQAGGRVRLVTPITIATTIGASPTLPAFGILTLHFVPEPGTLLLVGVGALALGAMGRARR